MHHAPFNKESADTEVDWEHESRDDGLLIIRCSIANRGSAPRLEESKKKEIKMAGRFPCFPLSRFNWSRERADSETPTVTETSRSHEAVTRAGLTVVVLRREHRLIGSLLFQFRLDVEFD